MLGYDPAQVQQLDGAVRRAADHLLRLPAGDDPLAGAAVSVARLARTHLEQDWMPLLVRVAMSAAMGAFDATGPAPMTRAHSTGVIASVVEAMTPDERRYFQGFVDATAVAVAQELSRYDDHGEYEIDHLPAELTTLDSANDWNWLAQLYLVEQYHDMVERGDVELQRDGDVYWIDPFHLVDVKSEVMSEVILAAVTLGGGMRPGGGITRATADTATSTMPPARILAGASPPPRPAGAVESWTARVADNGYGWFWQRPGSERYADSVRVMDFDVNGRYEHGYVVFGNSENQPLTLAGKPGPQAETHIPRAPDGSYPIPKGWPDQNVLP